MEENSTSVVSDSTGNDTDYSSLSSKLYRFDLSRKKASFKDCFVLLERMKEDSFGKEKILREKVDLVTHNNKDNEIKVNPAREIINISENYTDKGVNIKNVNLNISNVLQLDAVEKDTINLTKEVNGNYTSTEANESCTIQPGNSKRDARPATTAKYPKKRFFCIYCKQTKTNFYRHLEIVHKEEDKVKEFLNLEKNSSERRRLIDIIRDNGSFEYNKNHLDKPILARRRFIHPVPECPEKYFLPCPECRKQLSHKNLYKHYRTCNGRANSLLHARSVKRRSKALMTNINPLANEILLKKIIPPMQHDGIFEILRNDKLIILFGNHLTPKYTGHQEYIIRNQMRTMARYLKIVMELCPEINELCKLFTPRYFEISFQAVNKLAGLNLSGTYKSPKTALQMIQFLKICCNVLKNYYIKTEKNKKMKKRTMEFQSLLEVEAAGRINKPAHKNLVDNSRQKMVQTLKKLPASNDVEKFKIYLSKFAEIKYQMLKKHGFKLELWKELAEVVLLFLVVFNKKRSGESNRILITDFENLQQLSDTALPEIYEDLTDAEKAEAKSFYKIIIRGKLNRVVWVFVPKYIKTYLDYIYEHRALASIPEDNPYLFGLPGILSGNRHKTLETCALMRKYTILAHLQNPHSIRTTLLRKHFATKVSTLNLEDAQQETVQDFMGHQEKIHKTFYRQQVVSKDLLMTKILNNTTNKDLPSTSTSNADVKGAVNVTGANHLFNEEEMHQRNAFRRKLFNASKKAQQDNTHLPPTRSQNITMHSLVRVEKAKKCRSKKETGENGNDSSIDSENAIIYQRNLHVLKTTPKKTNCRIDVRPREKQSTRKCTLKNRSVQPLPEVDGEEQVNNPYSTDDDDSIKLENLEEDTDDSFSDEFKDRIKRSKNRLERGHIQIRPRLMTPQKKKMLEVFADHIRMGTYPSGKECLAAIGTYPELRDRTTMKIKSFLQHYMKKSKY